MGACVPNFWCVSFFVWPGGVTIIHKYTYTHIEVKLEISSTGCWPHVDFENQRLQSLDLTFLENE